MKHHLAKFLGELTRTARFSAVRAFWADVNKAIGGHVVAERQRMDRLMGELLADGAAGLAASGSPRAAGYAAALSIIHDPGQLRRHDVRQCLRQPMRAAVRSSAASSRA
jgi:hypothetical protein